MTVLDAHAVVAFLSGEPAATEVRDLLRDPAREPSVSATNWAEAFDVLARVKARGVLAVSERLQWLLAGGLQVIPVDEAIGRDSGRIRAQHYHRRDRQLSLADCTALATAMHLGQPLATADPAIVATAASLGVSVIPLPDAQGRRPA